MIRRVIGVDGVPRSVRRIRARLAREVALRRRYEAAMQPEVVAWLEANPDRGARFSEDELDELFSLFGTGGPLTPYGVEYFAAMIERKRKLKEAIAMVAEEQLEFLERLVELVLTEQTLKRSDGASRTAGSE